MGGRMMAIFTTALFVALGVYSGATEKQRLWKSKEYQDTRKMFIGAGRPDPSAYTAEMRKKYGYKYDPWCEEYERCD